VDRNSATRFASRAPWSRRARHRSSSANHEFNAIAYSQWNEERSDFCRSRTEPNGKKHHKQHQAFIEQIGLDTPESREVLDWFRTTPMWLDLGGLRVVHACWDQQSIDHLATVAGPGNGVTNRIIIDGTNASTATHNAIEILIKGPEIDLDGRVYLDKGGHERRHARQQWWKADAKTLRDVALIPTNTKGQDGEPFSSLPETPLDDVDRTTDTDDVPVIVGHYWENGTPAVLGPKAACVDHSAGRGGPLVAYRWDDGDTDLTDDKFVSF
jgi:hypothetical protein